MAYQDDPTADEILAAPPVTIRWAPIETADRDGQVVLLAHNDGGVRYTTPGWFNEDTQGWWEMNSHPTDYVDNPIPNPFAWAPMPNPPGVTDA